LGAGALVARFPINAIRVDPYCAPRRLLAPDWFYWRAGCRNSLPMRNGSLRTRQPSYGTRRVATTLLTLRTLVPTLADAACDVAKRI
jgi:hypothetical protein